MATLGSTYFDLIELYKRQDGMGNFVDVIEILSEMNPVLADAIAVVSLKVFLLSTVDCQNYPLMKVLFDWVRLWRILKR